MSDIRGRDWAGRALVAFLGTMTLSMVISISQYSAAFAPADLIAGA